MSLIAQWYSGGKDPNSRTLRLQNIAAEAVAKQIDMHLTYDAAGAVNTFKPQNPSLYHRVMTDPELTPVTMQARANAMHRSRNHYQRWRDDIWWHHGLRFVLNQTSRDIDQSRAQMADFNRVSNMMANEGVRDKYARGKTPWISHNPLLRLATPVERLGVTGDRGLTPEFESFVRHEVGLRANPPVQHQMDGTVAGMIKAIRHEFPRFDHETALIVISQLLQEFKRLHP